MHFDPDGLAPSQLFARFFHLEKIALARRAALHRSDFDSVTLRLSGLRSEELSNLRAGFEQALDRRVAELLGEPAISSALERLPFRQGDVIVALGDSITDDALSWANQLDLLLAKGRPDLGLRVLNFGYTGDTTQEVISRFDTVLAANPTWIVQLLGTNDARLHTSLRVATTSPSETARNLAVLHRLATEVAGARHVPMTPPPADARRADEWESFKLESIGWRSEDVEVIADIIAQSDDHVDLHTAFTLAADETLLLPDGIHPSIAGQSLIVRTLLERLTTFVEPTEATTEKSPHLDMTERSTP